MANLAALDIPGTEELLARLLQVRVEDFDGRTGWRRFQEARRRLRGAPTIGERRDAAVTLVETGLALFGPPVDEEVGSLEDVVVEPSKLRLVAYEVIVA